MGFAFGGLMKVLSREKAGGLAQHFGVQFSDGKVVEFTPTGVAIVSAQKFANGNPVVVVRTVPKHVEVHVKSRLAQALANPKAYNLFEWNCECFVNWLIGEKPVSKQVNGWLLLGLFAFIGLAFA